MLGMIRVALKPADGDRQTENAIEGNSECKFMV
jgi:hypothetical protein